MLPQIWDVLRCILGHSWPSLSDKTLKNLCVVSCLVPLEHLVRVLTTDDPRIPETDTNIRSSPTFRPLHYQKRVANINRLRGKPGTKLPHRGYCQYAARYIPCIVCIYVRNACVLHAYTTSEITCRGKSGQAMLIGCSAPEYTWNLPRALGGIKSEQKAIAFIQLCRQRNSVKNSLCPLREWLSQFLKE